MLICADLARLFVFCSALAMLTTSLAFAQERPTDTKAATDAAIREHRMGTLTIRTAPNAVVRVRQQRHEFPFGTAVSTRALRRSMSVADRRKYMATLKENFNAAVHENALKWPSTEREQGRVSWEDADTILSWCEKNSMPMRGHCIFWGIPKYIQPWIKALDDEALEATLKKRAFALATRYRGRIGEYDVNNEMVKNSYYADRLGENIRLKMFQWVREADPDAVLYLNDYGVLTPDRHQLERYEKQIAGFIEKGAPVGGIGCQGHFNTPIDPVKLKDALDRLARFRLPIKVTEFDVDIADEEAKATSVTDFYRTCFAHPAVEGILMWGFWEGAHWKPQAALWKRDWTPTPAAKAYRDLIYGEWWTDFEGKADDQGVCTVRAFYGTHTVQAGETLVTVALTKEGGAKTLDVGR